MKRLTTIMIALAMLAAMVSCNTVTVGDGVLDVPSDATTEKTYETTTVLTTETSETAVTTAVPEVTLPELDINSEECLMFRLMDMKLGDIESEFIFGERLRYGGMSDNGNQTLYVTQGDDEYQLLYLLKDYYIEGSDSWEISKETKPNSVTISNFDAEIYPGIKGSMTTAEVAEIIPKWDGVRMWSDLKIITFFELDGLTYTVTWNLDDETRNAFVTASLENNSVDQEKLRYDFAQKFMNNIAEYSANVYSVSISKSKYADYTPPEEPEYITPADELDMCTVYDVTSDKDSLYGPCDEWLWKETEEMPRKIALRFTDLDGLTIIMDIAEGVYFDKSIYYVTRIFNDDVDIVIPHGDGFRYIYDEVYVRRIGNLTVVANTHTGSERFYVIKGDEFDVIRNSVLYEYSVYDLVETDDGFSYISYSWNYHGTLIRPSSTIRDYVSKKHFCEYGKLVFENGEAEFMKDGDMTFEEWYLSDLFKWKEQREQYGTKTFEELAEIYEGLPYSEQDLWE